MKKIIFFVFFACLSFCLCSPISAEDVTTIPEEFFEVIDELPSEVSDRLPSEMLSKSSDEISAAVERMSTPEYLLSLVRDVIGKEIKSKLSLFCSLIGLLLISAIFNSMKNGLMESALSRAVGFCSVSIIFALLTSSLLHELEGVTLFFERIGALMSGVAPAIGVIYAMGGNVTTAAASSGTLYVFLLFCEKIVAKTVVPVSAVLTSLSLCTSLSPDLKISSLSSALRKCYTFFLTLIMSVLLFILSSQTVISASKDGISARAAKLMASSAIPIVGGSVGETLRTVGAAVSYIKSVTGIGGIFFIFILVLPTLISLLIIRLLLIFAASAAEMLGCSPEARVLGDMGGIYGTILAVVSLVGISFILVLGLFIRCTVAVG